MRSPVNVHDAKTHLSRLLERAEAGEEIVIARNGEPIAKLVPYRVRKAARKLGLYRGQFTIPADLDAADAEIQRLFEGEE